MNEMRIIAVQGTQKADMRPLAEYYCEQILGMVDNGKFKDPAIEAEFQEWKRERDRKAGVQ